MTTFIRRTSIVPERTVSPGSHFKTRLWAKSTLENKPFSEPTEGFETTSSVVQKRRRMHTRPTQWLLAVFAGTFRAIAGLLWMLGSIIAFVAAAAVGFFIFPWMLMLPLILAGGLVETCEFVTRWLAA